MSSALHTTLLFSPKASLSSNTSVQHLPHPLSSLLCLLSLVPISIPAFSTTTSLYLAVFTIHLSSFLPFYFLLFSLYHSLYPVFLIYCPQSSSFPIAPPKFLYSVPLHHLPSPQPLFFPHLLILPLPTFHPQSRSMISPLSPPLFLPQPFTHFPTQLFLLRFSQPISPLPDPLLCFYHNR